MFHLPTTAKFGINFALVISIILTTIKFIIGGLSGSLAIIGSALDSLLDIFVSTVNAVALWLSGKSGTRTFAYGLGKVQGFAAIFEGVVVLSSGIFLAWGGVGNYLAHRSPEVTLIEIGAMLIAMFGTSVIMWNFLRIAKVNNSLIIRADALHYSSDLFMNGGILVALLATKFLGWWWADAVIALGIGLWIVKNALPIIWSGITMLLDRALSEEEVQGIETLITNHEEIESYHYLKTRRSGDDVFIEVHIVFKNKDISLRAAHDVSDELESELGARFPGAHITVHLDVDDAPELCDLRTKTCQQ